MWSKAAAPRRKLPPSRLFGGVLTVCVGVTFAAKPSPVLLAETGGHGASLHRASLHEASLHGSANGRAPGYLGIEFHDLSEEQARSLGLKRAEGVEIVMVDHDGPAGKAGLRAQDVLISLNGQQIRGATALRHMIREAGAGMQVALGILRGGHSVSLNAQLADPDAVARAALARLAAANTTAPPPPAPIGDGEAFVSGYAADSAPAAAPHPQGFFGSMLHAAPLGGAVVDAMEPQLAVYFGAPQGMGLLVHSVLSGSPAADAGLRAGDVVLRADLVPLHSTAEWTKHLHAAKGRPVTLTVLRERRELMMTLPADMKRHSLVEWPVLF